MGTARYAIYYAPARNDPLWTSACQWLGRDAYTDEPVGRVGSVGLHDIDLPELTKSPAHYGFHATLKAPFELRAGVTEDHLLTTAEAFAGEQRAFDVRLSPATLSMFIALCPIEPSAPIVELHRHSVICFDEFRAPLTDADIGRREGRNLSPRQQVHFRTWGYPWIFEDFRFHMTLTGAIHQPSTRCRVLEHLRQRFPPAYHRVSAIAIFFQPDRETPFKVLQRFDFAE